MASVEAQAGVSSKHKAAINEMMKELEKELLMEASNVTVAGNAKAIATVKVAMQNQTLGANISLSETKDDWCGHVVGTYTKTIPRDRVGKFTHQATPPTELYGSWGAVVYFGSNTQGGSDNCAWLLAWHVPADGTTNNKVYVKAGDNASFAKGGTIQWDDIKTSLEASSNGSYYKDDVTGAEVSASIGAGNSAAVSAVFDVSL